MELHAHGKEKFQELVFPPNTIYNMKSHVGKQLYRLGPITIASNNQEYFKNYEYTIVRLSILILTTIQTISAYSASVYIFFILIF